jgi:hypothetical protein
MAIIGGEYEVGELLARGGTGSVYAGVRIADGSPVAIKLLDFGRVDDWKVYDLFERGGRLLQGLSHPGLPRVYAMGRQEDGTLYQVRERFEGGTLRERIEHSRALPSARTGRELLIALLRTLQHLHGRLPPVIHRDIKPSNVMFRDASSWQPVLIDFESVAQAQASTGTTIVVSPGYTAPEQLGGRVAAQSDLYSLAATFLYVCTGREPTEMLAGSRPTPALFAGLDSDVAEVLAGMLEPIPEQRIASASEALERLFAVPRSARQGSPSALVRVGRHVALVVGVLSLATGMLSLGGGARMRQLRAGLSALALDFDTASERLVVQSAKGVAADLGMSLQDCTAQKTRLFGDYGQMMFQLAKIGGVDPREVGGPAPGDVFVVLHCSAQPYPIASFYSQDISVTFHSGFGVNVN